MSKIKDIYENSYGYTMEATVSSEGVVRSKNTYVGSKFEHAVGFLVASIFSLAYYVIPSWFIVGFIMSIVDPYSIYTWIVVAPLIISAIIPPIPMKWLLQTRAFQLVPVYFNYSEVMEISNEEIKNLMDTHPVMMCAHPHGVFSMAALCSAVKWSSTWWDPSMTPTAAANSVINTPILKHVVGMLGLTNASAGPLKKALQTKRGVILYPGGTSELFLTNPDHERLHLLDRKGFIKVALTQGCAVVPMYFFGNTKVLKLLQWPILRYISRKTGVALTYFYGRFFLPMPLPEPCKAVIGKPIYLPKIENPTEDDIDQWHAVYVKELTRIFDTYKVEAIGYEDKCLELE